MKTVLTIAGSDCSGGAGIQGDIKTIAAYGLYSESVITALTAQNTLGVAAVMQVPPEFLKKQLECVFEDIFPDAVKIGMIPEKAQMQVIEEILKKYKVKNIVMDTVMISTSGHHLMDPSATSYYQKRLLPLADVMTPNIPEAEWLLKRKIKTREEKVAAALDFEVQYNSAILLKGGHEIEDADDLLVVRGRAIWYQQNRIENSNTHGTGCTLSSAVACGLAMGLGIEESVGRAKEYITGAIQEKLNLGKGNGPLNHMYRIKD